ncbi:MAG: rfaQ 3 [Gemmatimonadetes bacterium]|nr:rfaQ 3 [Gemmatimonadota bacterium]
MRTRLVVKRVVYSLLSVASVFRRRSRTVPDHAQLKEVLVVQLGLLGDVLLITPLIQHLRETLPSGARITLVVPPSSRAVAEGVPHVDCVQTYDAFWADPADNHRHAFRVRHVAASWRFIRRNRGIAYDLVVNCWVMDQPLTALLLSCLRSRCILGFDFRYSRAFYDMTWPFNRDHHISDNVLAMYRGSFSLPMERTDGRLQYVIPGNVHSRTFDALFREIGAPYLLISPFSSESAKEWDLSHWTTVLNALGHAYPHATIVLTGLAEARERSETLAAAMNTRLLNAVGGLTFGQFAHMVRHAAVIITTDSGAMHLASAFDVPVFVLFSQIYNYRQYVPYHVVNDFSVVPVPCAECIYGCAAVACMKHDVTTVLGKLRRLCDSIPALSETSTASL